MSRFLSTHHGFVFTDALFYYCCYSLELLALSMVLFAFIPSWPYLESLHVMLLLLEFVLAGRINGAICFQPIVICSMFSLVFNATI